VYWTTNNEKGLMKLSKFSIKTRIVAASLLLLICSFVTWLTEYHGFSLIGALIVLTILFLVNWVMKMKCPLCQEKLFNRLWSYNFLFVFLFKENNYCPKCNSKL